MPSTPLKNTLITLYVNTAVNLTQDIIKQNIIKLYIINIINIY